MLVPKLWHWVSVHEEGYKWHTATQVDAREVRVGEQDIDVRAAVLSYTSAWNLTGLPAISLPVGLVNGMPVGLQVIGAAGEDERLLQVMAKLFERE